MIRAIAATIALIAATPAAAQAETVADIMAKAEALTAQAAELGEEALRFRADTLGDFAPEATPEVPAAPQGQLELRGGKCPEAKTSREVMGIFAFVLEGEADPADQEQVRLHDRTRRALEVMAENKCHLPGA